MTDSDPWSLAATIPYTNNSYTYNTADTYKYKYMLTSYNSSGNSCREIQIVPKCNSFSTPFADINNVTYNNNASISACFINIKNTKISGAASVVFDSDIETNIEESFEVNTTGTGEIK